MLTFTIKVNEKAVIEEVEEWVGVKITPAHLKRFIKNDPSILTCLSEDGIDCTEGRERICDQIAEECGLNGWPICADGNKAWNKFWKQLKKKAPLQGFKITSDDEED